MSNNSDSTSSAAAIVRASWLPLSVILLAQIQMAFNVNAIPVSIGPIVEELDIPATSVGTALVLYALFVAAFVMVGAKIGRLFGQRLIFQVMALIHGVAMIIMALSPNATVMNGAQILAGIAAAALVPTLVVLITANYHGQQQAQALGILAGTPAISGALAFFIAGLLGTLVSWRVSFAILGVLSLIVFALSFKLAAIPRQPEIKIDLVGALLSAAAIILITLGFNNLNNWGILLASPDAPIAPLGLSPAPFMIVIGLVLAQFFFIWSHRRATAEKTPLLALEVLDSREERSNIIAFLVIGSLGPAVNFLIPLYIQIVQGQSTLFTAVAVVPYTIAIAASAMLIVRLFGRLTPRRIALAGFILVSIGLTILAFTIRNTWGTPIVIFSLILIGIGEGTLLTLLFNVMVSASPKELAGDVGALRGVANNLSTALGTAFAGLAAIVFLTLFLGSGIANSNLSPSLVAQVNLDNADFISNEQLNTFLVETTTASQTELTEAILINEAARLRALKAAFLVLAAFSLLALVPALGLPNYLPGELPYPVHDEKKEDPD